MTNVDAIKDLYEAMGGSAEDFKATTNPEAIEALAEVTGLRDVIVEAEAQSTELFETPVSSIQDADVTIGSGYISGTLKYLSTGPLPAGHGPGNFMALKFINLNPGTVVKIGIVPTEGSGFVALDDDMNATVKVTDKDEQVFKVVTEYNGITKTQTYSLSRLTLLGA